MDKRRTNRRGSREPPLPPGVDGNHEPDPQGRSRFNLDTAILLLASLVFVTAIGALLFGDRFFREESGGGTSVGRLSASSGDVRRRSPNGVAWSQARTGDLVFEGDSVFTGAASNAAIQIGDSGVLDVGAQSLIVMRSAAGRVELDLRYGTLQGEIQDGQTVVLKVDGEKKELIGKRAQIRIVRGEHDKDARIEVVKGQLRVGRSSRSSKGRQSVRDATRAVPESILTESIVIREHEAARVGSNVNNTESRRLARIDLLEPQDNSKLWLPAAAPVHFVWRSSDPKEKFVLEVAKDASFANIIANAAPTTSGKATLKGLPRDGLVAWRIRPADPSIIAEPAMRRLSLWSNAPPTLQSPLNGATVLAKSEPEVPAKLKFVWADRSGAASFRFQLLNEDPESDVPLHEAVARGETYEGPQPPEGRYRWRVRADDPDRPEASWSASHSLIVSTGKPLLTPLLKNPFLAYSIPSGSSLGLKATGGRIGQTPGLAPMQWTYAAQAARFVVERSRDGLFKNPLITNINSSSLLITEAEPGILHWRVRAVAKDGRMSAPSAAGRWAIYAPAPVLNNVAPIALSFDSHEAAKAAKAKLPLSWRPTEWASEYEVEVADNVAFLRAKRLRSPRPLKPVEVSQPAEYAWRVRSLDGTGTPLSQWSNYKLVSFTKAVLERKMAAVAPAPSPPVNVEPVFQPSAARPEPIEPRPATSIVALAGSSSFINFRWKPVPGATEYRIEISQTPSFASAERSANVKRSSYFLDGSFPSGARYWRVRAVVEGKPTQWSEPSMFKVQSASAAER